MSHDSRAGYRFPDGIPINPIDPATTVFVSGPALSRADDLALSMIANGTGTDEGMLVISTNMTYEKLLNQCRQLHPSIDTARVGVIDCSGQAFNPSESEMQVKYVSTQSDLTGIGMKFSSLYESMYADAKDGRIRAGLLTLSSLSMYVDLRTLFQFIQTLSARIDSAGGLGVFTLDPTTHDTKTVNTLGQVADGRIEVREPEDDDERDIDGELRTRGLPDQPEGWQPFSFSES